MSLFFNEIAEINRAHCASHGIPTAAYKTNAATEYPARRPIQRCDDMYAETSGATLAYDWIQRCRVSELEALKVLSEMDSQDALMARFLHLASNVGTYTDCSKVMCVLVDSVEGAMLSAANHE